MTSLSLKEIDINKDNYPCAYTIGFFGELTGGKTTAAKTAELLLQAFYNVKVCSFARDVKRIAKSFGWDGSKDAKGRRLLQVIGTEAGRAYDADLWIKLTFMHMLDIFDYSDKNNNIVMFDDLRFVNEAEWIRSRGGVIIQVVDNKVKNDVAMSHASEKGIPDCYADLIIRNDLNIFHLVQDMHLLLNRLGFRTLKAGESNGE